MFDNVCVTQVYKRLYYDVPAHAASSSLCAIFCIEQVYSVRTYVLQLQREDRRAVAESSMPQ